jgi:hypothetical protein
MAKIKIEEVIDHLDTDVRRALADAVKETIPSANFDEYSLFRAFKRSIRRRCRTWENVPDNYVDD